MFFFFKQKTAYEMRISDWSSDVCSSDLAVAHAALAALALVEHRVAELVADVFQRRVAVVADDREHRLERGVQPAVGALGRVRVGLQEFAVGIDRSEEHTSELQSLMRISYDVFCLKKKNKKIHYMTITL